MTDEIKDETKEEKQTREYVTRDKSKINPATGRRWKTGGRKKGTKNNPQIKLVREMKKAELENIKTILDENTSPLAFLLRTINDANEDIKIRVDAAGKALPYVHGKRPNITEISGRDGKPVEFATAAARDALNGLLFEGTATPVLEYKEGETLEHDLPPQTEKQKSVEVEMNTISALTEDYKEDDETDNG